MAKSAPDWPTPKLIQQIVSDLTLHAKHDPRPGYRIEFQERRQRDGGSNLEIAGIYIDSEQDLLHLAGKTADFQLFQTVLARLQRDLPELEDWIRRNPLKLSSLFEILDGLIAVVEYLKLHPRPGVFARELPLAIDSKFVERHHKILDQWLECCSRELRVFGETSFFLKYGLRDDKQHHAIHILDPVLQSEFIRPPRSKRRCNGSPRRNERCSTFFGSTNFD